jgi:1,2-diacylglycerol 3-alpha-glucosyltransferase
MKSVLITSNAYFPNVGGIENSLRYLAHAYYRKGYRVDVVVSDVNGINDRALPLYEVIEGIHIHRYSTQHSLPRLLKPFEGFFTLIAQYNILRRIKIERNPYFTISRFHTPTCLAKLAKLQNVVYLLPGIVKFQNHPERLSTQTGFTKLKQVLRYHYHVWLQQNALRSADRLAVFSENMRTQVNSCIKHPYPLLLVKPGVDCMRFKPVNKDEIDSIRIKFNIPLDRMVLLCIGRFVKAKGFMYVLEGLKKLDRVHLVLVGGGEEEQLYRDYVVENDLESQVSFTGVLQDPSECYQLADLFIMSSTYEPLGQTILEALSSGLPIVAFKPSDSVITATLELLSNEEACYIDDLSSDSFVKKIISLIESPTQVEHFSHLSRTIAEKRFSWDKLAERLEYCE